MSTLARLRRQGFTIVELLIVIVVIAILAAITIVAFNGIQQRATASLIQSELSQNVKTLASYYITNSDVFPADANAGGLSSSADSTLTYEPAPDFKSYCMQIVNKGQVYKVTNTETAPSVGLCSSTVPSYASITSTSFTLNWTAVAGATAYDAQCARDAAYTVGVVTNSVTSTTSNFTGLTAGTAYYCRTQADIGTVVGPWSATATSATAAPAVPTGLASASLTATSFTLNWTTVPGVVGYSAQCALTTGYSPTVYNNTSLTTNTASITGLSGATTYYCRVLSRGTSTNSVYSTNLTVTTATPGVPGSLTSSSLTNSSFTFSWGAVSGAIGYTAQCATDAGFTTIVASGSPTVTNMAVSGRTAGTAHYCRVLTRGTNANSAYSTAITITTLP